MRNMGEQRGELTPRSGSERVGGNLGERVLLKSSHLWQMRE